MKKIIILIPFLLMAFNLKQEYLNKNYKNVCLFGSKQIYKFKNNANILSLIGEACVKSDYFIYLPYIINNLKFSQKARQNSIYFSLLFFEKKLLQSYLLDNINLSYYKLPLVNHPISIVFNNIKNHNFKKVGNKLIIKQNGLIYKVFANDQDKFFINIYKNNKLIKSHWYR